MYDKELKGKKAKEVAFELIAREGENEEEETRKQPDVFTNGC